MHNIIKAGKYTLEPVKICFYDAMHNGCHVYIIMSDCYKIMDLLKKMVSFVVKSIPML